MDVEKYLYNISDASVTRKPVEFNFVTVAILYSQTSLYRLPTVDYISMFICDEVGLNGRQMFTEKRKTRI